MDKKETGTLGTFAGVFTPSILTILGIILFLRLGYVVGEAGLFRALIMIGIANLISILTSFSLAAISTNMKIKGGGDYYLISRTLGLEFGGAIGIVLFLAQSVSIAFYCLGFGESIAGISGSFAGEHTVQLIAGTALIFLFVLAWIGADLATKFQYVVMTILVLALVSFYIGGLTKFDGHLLVNNWNAPGSGPGFWVLFALFFPAVTGFTQGVSMSGDLKDPGKSLPVGTFAAVFLSIIVYFSVAVIFAASNTLSDLSGNYAVMKQTAYTGLFIDAGVIAATLSSAMASFLGAPRILQSLSADKIFGFLTVFEKGYGQTNNPRRAVFLSFVIAVATIVLGQLDLIAGIVSMFFLISYGLLNIATYYEAATQSPSFRPRFKLYDRRLSLFGFIACAGVMAAIDYKTAVAAGAVLFSIYQYLKQPGLPSRWSDSRRSFHLKMIRDNLLATRQTAEHPRDWRPFVLALSNNTGDMVELLDFSKIIEGNSGITTAVQMIQGSGYKSMKYRQDTIRSLAAIIKSNRFDAYPLVISTEEVEDGLRVLFQSYGIGPIRANTVLINWNQAGSDKKNGLFQGDLRLFARSALQNECNLLMVDLKLAESIQQHDDTPAKDTKTIDVWWKGDDTSYLIILLAYMAKRHEDWEDAQIRLLAIQDSRLPDQNLEELEEALDTIRIEAAPQLVSQVTPQVIEETSGQSDLVFIPVFLSDNLVYVMPGLPAEAVMPRLKRVALGMAAKKIDLSAEPEEGKPAELAQLMDALKNAEKRVALAEKNAGRATTAASDMMQSISMEDTLANAAVMADLKKALAAREKADMARRKVKIERSKLEDLTKQAKDEGIHTNSEQ